MLAVDKEDLVPPVPVLTRYKKELGIKAFVKKEIQEVRPVDERKSSEIVQLTMSKLCVRLNSLYVSLLLTTDAAMLLLFRTTYQVPGQFLVHKDVNEKEKTHSNFHTRFILEWLTLTLEQYFLKFFRLQIWS